MFKSGYQKYFFFDVETTGLDFSNNEIIEFAYILYDEKFNIIREEDFLIKIDGIIPKAIEELTGITNEMVQGEITVEDAKLISKRELYHNLREAIDSKTILIAYNAPFDLQFYYYLMLEFSSNFKIESDFFDVLAVYRDRHTYPHKLENAIEKYQVKGDNSHRAIDDIFATVNVFKKMAKEKNNFKKYINKVGYLKKWGQVNIDHIFNYQIEYFAQQFNGEDYLKQHYESIDKHE